MSTAVLIAVIWAALMVGALTFVRALGAIASRADRRAERDYRFRRVFRPVAGHRMRAPQLSVPNFKRLLLGRPEGPPPTLLSEVPHSARNPMLPLEGRWHGMPVQDVYGGRLGAVHAVVLDPETNLEWIVLELARGGGTFALVPARGAVAEQRVIRVAHARERVRSAPRSPVETAYRDGAYRSLLYRHYHLTDMPRQREALSA